jgi:hypothetical protein
MEKEIPRKGRQPPPPAGSHFEHSTAHRPRGPWGGSRSDAVASFKKAGRGAPRAILLGLIA